MSNQHLDTYREIFYSCVEGIIIVQQGKIILANPQCELLFGYKIEELMGMSIEKLIPQELRKQHEKLRAGYSKKPETREMGVGIDLVALKKDGTTFPVEISLNPADIMGGKSTIAHIIDISRRKEVEKELKRSEEQLIKYATELEMMVKDRTKKMDKALDRLKKTNTDLEEQIKERIRAENEARMALEKEKELNELKTRFVSMASHEFRTPLSTILSSASLIGKYISKENEDKKLKHINRIKTNVAELTSILNDFLSLDRLDAGKLFVNPQDVKVCDLFEAIAIDMKSLTKKEQVIEFNCGQNGEHVFHTDSQILRQIIVNLLSNAIKYSPEGSVIKLNAEGTDDNMHIEVIDQGIGIPEADQKHLFSKFFRAHNASHIQGTGLGLNIVQKYLELIDGEISFESEQGKGSTFKVDINTLQNG